jgi:hypothetical protein
MGRYLDFGLVFALVACSAFAAQDVASAVVGTVKAIDKGTKTVVVKVSDGPSKRFTSSVEPSRMVLKPLPREARTRFST